MPVLGHIPVQKSLQALVRAQGPSMERDEPHVPHALYRDLLPGLGAISAPVLGMMPVLEPMRTSGKPISSSMGRVAPSSTEPTYQSEAD